MVMMMMMNALMMIKLQEAQQMSGEMLPRKHTKRLSLISVRQMGNKAMC